MQPGQINSLETDIRRSYRPFALIQNKKRTTEELKKEVRSVAVTSCYESIRISNFINCLAENLFCQKNEFEKNKCMSRGPITCFFLLVGGLAGNLFLFLIRLKTNFTKLHKSATVYK